MKLLRTNLIDILILAAIATTGTVAAAPDQQAPPPETRNEDSPSPAELTATRCLICHGNTTSDQGRLAPPFAMVKSHYESLSEEEFIETVSSWVKEPGKHKSQMPGAIRRFGLMPALTYPDAEVAAIARYVYETDFAMPGRGGQGMGQGGGNGCGGGCGSEGSGSYCGACETAEDGTPSPAVKPIEKATPATSPAKKWPVPVAMMVHLLDLERDLTAFEGKTPAKHAKLARRIEKNLNQLISSCTMDGEGHNALHEWLVPFRELAKQQADSADPVVQMEKVREMHAAFATFHERFVSAPRP